MTLTKQVAKTIERVLASGDKPLYNRLYSYAMALVRNADDAYELTQQALKAACERANKNEAPMREPIVERSVERWLFKQVYFAALNLWRERRLQRIRLVTILPVELGDLADDGLMEDRFAERDALRGAMVQLPPRQGTCLYLRVVERMLYAEIAELLDIAEVNVRVHVCRARKTMKRLLEYPPRASPEDSSEAPPDIC